MDAARRQWSRGCTSRWVVSMLDVVLVATSLYEFWSHNRFVEVGLRGALAAAVGVMVATGWTLIRPFWKDSRLLV